MPDGTMYSQSWNYYYGPLYGQCDIETPHKLREKIVKQYGDQVPHTNDFEVWYFRGQQKVWIMTDDNLTDAWSTLSKGTGFLCHGGKEVSQAGRFFW